MREEERERIEALIQAVSRWATEGSITMLQEGWKPSKNARDVIHELEVLEKWREAHPLTKAPEIEPPRQPKRIGIPQVTPALWCDGWEEEGRVAANVAMTDLPCVVCGAPLEEVRKDSPLWCGRCKCFRSAAGMGVPLPATQAQALPDT